MREREPEKKGTANSTPYRRVISSNTSRLEAHAGYFRLFMKGIFDAYVLWHFSKNNVSELVMHIRTHNSVV